ncbi:hypothetical protein NHJ13734_007782 [Beauveria thailandica]
MTPASSTTSTHRHHHTRSHAAAFAYLQRSQRNRSWADEDPHTTEEIPQALGNTVEAVSEGDAVVSRLSVSDHRASGTGSPSYFAEAASTAGSNVASEEAIINTTPTPMLDSGVVLRVGENLFFTTRATVAESQLLMTLLSTEATQIGEYFLDADPDAFSHVLRFLRTRRFPLFYNHASGYDTAKYLELLVAAQYYRIPTLEMWLAEKRYLGIVNIKSDYRKYRLFGVDQITRMEELCWDREEQGRILSVSETIGKAHACPQKRWRHDGDKEKCKRAKCYGTPSTTLVLDMAMMRIIDMTAIVTKAEIRESVLSAGPYSAELPPYPGGSE